MTHENKKYVQREVAQGGWTIIWIGAEMPCEFLNEEVELMYVDMDGYPCRCKAVYTYDKNYYRHCPYFKRAYTGAKMVNCIAWRRPLK